MRNLRTLDEDLNVFAFRCSNTHRAQHASLPRFVLFELEGRLHSLINFTVADLDKVPTYSASHSPELETSKIHVERFN